VRRAHLIAPAGYYDPTESVPPMSPCSGVPMSEQVCCEVPAQPTSQGHSGDRILQLPISSEEPAVWNKEDQMDHSYALWLESEAWRMVGRSDNSDKKIISMCIKSLASSVWTFFWSQIEAKDTTLQIWSRHPSKQSTHATLSLLTSVCFVIAWNIIATIWMASLSFQRHSAYIKFLVWCKLMQSLICWKRNGNPCNKNNSNIYLSLTHE
jgi:hypothetical protein